MRLAACLAATLLVSTPLLAQLDSVIITVDDLQSVCTPALQFLDKASDDRTPGEAVRLVRCLGYVEGLVSTVVRLSLAGFMTDPLYESTFCFPDTTEPRNWVESFISWAAANPEKADTPAVDGFLLALIEAYPCQGSGDSSPPPNSP